MSGVGAHAESGTALERLAPYTAIPAVALAVTGLVLALLTDSARAVAGHVFEDVVLAIVWSALAAAIINRMPRHPVGWLFILIGASHGVAVAIGQSSARLRRFGVVTCLLHPALPTSFVPASTQPASPERSLNSHRGSTTCCRSSLAGERTPR
jgi:hypothetical protein